MAKHTTYIFSEDAKGQVEFYIQALGGEILSVMTHGELPNAKEELKDKVIHLSMIAGGVPFYLCDGFTPVNPGNAISQSMEFETEAEARDAFDKLAAGGKVTHPLAAEFWGDLFGQLEDKYGILWMITAKSEQAQS